MNADNVGLVIWGIILVGVVGMVVVYFALGQIGRENSDNSNFGIGCIFIIGLLIAAVLAASGSL